MFRQQLPAYSPLTLPAILRAIPFGSGSRQARNRLVALLRERHEQEDAILCGSGTQALQLGLVGAQEIVGPDSVVVALPAFTCYDVAAAAVGASCRVTFYDIDPDTLTPDLHSLEEALLLGARVVVVAPLYGLQPAWDVIRTLMNRYDAFLIEDAAQSFGSRWKGEPAGSFGDLSVVSFGRGKGWTATTGGALLGSRRILDDLRREMPCSVREDERNSSVSGGKVLLRALAQWAFGRPYLYGIPSGIPSLQLGETVYHPPRDPMVMPGTAVSLALQTLPASQSEVECRRRIAGYLREQLSFIKAPAVRLPRPIPGSEPGFLRFPVLLDERPDAESHASMRRVGVFPPYPKPLPDLPPMLARIEVTRPPTPGARELTQRLLTLPTHSLQKEKDLERVLDIVIRTASRGAGKSPACG